jgi:hypothetical protein
MTQQITNSMFRILTGFLIILSTVAHAQWTTIYTTSVASTSVPYQICYTSDSAIFVSSKKEFIYSKNNGLAFTVNNSFITTPTVTIYNTYREFSDISFTNKDTGSITGYSNVSGTYYPFAQSSTGLFASWTLNHPITTTAPLSKINEVKHFKNQKVYAFDNNTNIYYSANGGTSWILKNTVSTTSPIFGYGMSMVDDQQGYYATRQGIYKTTDGGQTINLISGFPSTYLYFIKKIRFRDMSNGYVIASNSLGENKLFKTSNGGTNWQDVFQGKLPDPLIDVNFPTNDTGFVATSGYILQTFNAGTQWYIQRFTNTGFNELDFFDKNHGVAVAQTGASSLKIMKYVPNSISNDPFALFSFQTNYCCSGQVCNIINYGSPAWTYKWYVNNVLSSTVFTPGGFVLPYTGNNTVKLVTNNGTNKDSVSYTIYNASVFSGTSNFIITPYDTTICFGNQANLLIGNYSSQLSYSAFSNTLQISPWVTQSSGNLYLNTNPLNFNDTLLTVMAVSSYSNCPGNVFSKTKKVKVLPLPPSNLMSLINDSICSQDSVRMTIFPCTKGTNYKIWMNSTTLLQTFTASAGSSYYYGRDGLVYSRGFNYTSIDSNGCNITSPVLNVKIDSMWVKLETLIPAVFLGDTITIHNKSVATDYTWTYAPGTSLISNNDTVIKLKYGAIGDYYLSLDAKNMTGCRDSLIYHIGVYNQLDQGTGQVTCFSDTVLMDNLKLQPRQSWFIQTNTYHRFHTDISENYYLADNRYFSTNGWGTDPNYGSLHFRIMKYDRNGNLKWVVIPNFSSVSIGPNFNYVHTTIGSVSSDTKGNVYITGNFRGNLLKIGNVSRTFTTTSNSGLANAFIAKLDSNGNCKWILAMNKLNNTHFQPASIGKLIADQGNSIYFKADFIGTAVFTNSVVNIGGYNSYLVVIDSLGNFKRMKPLYNNDTGQGSVLSVDASSGSSYALYFTYDNKMIKYKNKLIHYAYTNRPVVQLFNGTNINAPTVAGYNSSSLMTYVIITDTMGNLLNYFKPAILYDSLAYSAVNSNYSYYPQYQPNISIDNAGNLYFQWNLGDGYSTNLIEPYYNDNFNKGKYNNMNLMLKLNDNSEIKKTDPFSIIVKYDLNGNVMWHKEADYVFTKSMVANNDGKIYGLGRFNKLATFKSTDNNDQMVTITDSSYHMLFYSYDASGNFLWAKTFQSIGNGCQYPGELIRKDSCNKNLYFSAGFDTTLSFMSNVYSQNNKMFVFKFSPDGSCSQVSCSLTSPVVTDITKNIVERSDIFRVIPNPNNGQFKILSNSNEVLFIKIYNSTGQLITETTLRPDAGYVTLDIQNSGMYYIRAKGITVDAEHKILIIR